VEEPGGGVGSSGGSRGSRATKGILQSAREGLHSDAALG